MNTCEANLSEVRVKPPRKYRVAGTDVLVRACNMAEAAALLGTKLLYGSPSWGYTENGLELEYEN